MKLINSLIKIIQEQTSVKCNVGNKCTVALNCEGTSSYHGVITSDCKCETPQGIFSSNWIDCFSSKEKSTKVTQKEVQNAVDAINSFIYGQLLHATNYTQKKMQENLQKECPQMFKLLEKSNEKMPYILIKYENLDGFHEVVMEWSLSGGKIDDLDRKPIHVKDCDFVKDVAENEFDAKNKEIIKKGEELKKN